VCFRPGVTCVAVFLKLAPLPPSPPSPLEGLFNNGLTRSNTCTTVLLTLSGHHSTRRGGRRRVKQNVIGTPGQMSVPKRYILQPLPPNPHPLAALTTPLTPSDSPSPHQCRHRWHRAVGAPRCSIICRRFPNHTRSAFACLP
jgi:hypothetical protein